MAALKSANALKYPEFETRTATLVVAAHDSSPLSRLQVDYICDGVVHAHIVEPCETAWTETVAPGVTTSADTVTRQVGAASSRFDVAAGVPALVTLATQAISPVSFPDHTSIILWIRCSIATATGNLRLLLDDNPGCPSPFAELSIPGLPAATWVRVCLSYSGIGHHTARSIGLRYHTDIGACTIWLDNIIRAHADEETLHEAISALPAGGGTVMLAEGTYIINTSSRPPLIPPTGLHVNRNNVTITGQGAGTLLLPAFSINAPSVSFIAVTAPRVTIKDLAIDLLESGLRVAPFYVIDGVLVSTTREATIHNLKIQGGLYAQAISLSATSRSIVANNIILGHPERREGGDGIDVFASSYNVISGNVIENVTSDGIDVSHGSHNNSIVGNVLRNTWGIALRWCGAKIPTPERNSVIGNTVEGGEYGISLWGGKNNTISGNTFRLLSHPGIHIDSDTTRIAERNIITGNSFEATSVGIDILRGSRHNIASNNNVVDAISHGIRISISAPLNTIEGNVIIRSRNHGIVVEADSNHSTIRGNTVLESSQLTDNTWDNIMISVSSFNTVEENKLRRGIGVNQPRGGIAIIGASLNNTIMGNDLRDSGRSWPMSWGIDPSNIQMYNRGFATESSGVATFSGTGALTTFTFAHGLITTPTVVNLEARSAHAAGDKHWSATATHITVTFITAPPAGVGNVVIGWESMVR